MLVSYVAGEGVELIVHKESVVVEEIKEVELRSRRAQFIYYRNYSRIGLQPRGHAPGRLPVKKLRHLVQKISFLIIPLHSQLIHHDDAEVYVPIASCFNTVTLLAFFLLCHMASTPHTGSLGLITSSFLTCIST